MTYTHGISFGVVGESVNVQMRGGEINTPNDCERCSVV